ncbi:Alpha/Beta hydrolase protein [Podospora appendiculata]|uniref:Alpha/Beta hydrolase protein n=1 Tax=Podospora appendiculata TaxID=314037 RepID=A0AAE0XKE5_9PEZI|nr:Alpha/Beta hydrolase protein [Podospora appendiculata]
MSKINGSAALGKSAVEFAQQAEKLSHRLPQNGESESETNNDGVAVEALFPAPYDPVIVTADGNRLPAVSFEEAHRLNLLREELESSSNHSLRARDEAVSLSMEKTNASGDSPEGTLRKSMPPSHTNPLFPPLPLYGPPSLLRDIQCRLLRVSSFFLGLAFLSVIVLGALFTSIPPFFQGLWHRMAGRDPDADRPFFEEEQRRKLLRRENERRWKRRRSFTQAHKQDGDQEENDSDSGGFVEGGPDPIVCDVGYYARRVGLDVEEYQVQTEDGFIIDLWHVYDPGEYTALPAEERAHRGPDVFKEPPRAKAPGHPSSKPPKFPVLLMHGLLQSAGAYCVNDEDSLAFFLCKSGFDVWLGNNRCGFRPKHVLLEYADPRMWCWNIRQMGVFDLPALTARVLYETGFAKLGLISHSQGTTQTFVALAKEQRPELGDRLTVFCALAPAAYAGPLIGKMYFKFMRAISPAMFRLLFGIHAFLPVMMTMHALLNARVYGWLGYKVFSFLFNWTDRRWDRGLRDRMFQFAPVFVSAESMRWWLGRECFAKHKCILSTKDEWRAEELEDQQKHEASILAAADRDMEGGDCDDGEKRPDEARQHHARRHEKGSTAWYNRQAPPFALWVCGNDCLVDGEKLMRRFERGREPDVDVVHSRVIEGYEHLDVIWAMDAVDRVFTEVREVLWKTCGARERERCRVPVGCEDVEAWVRPERGSGGGGGEGDPDGGLQSSSSEDLSA